jgi:hypothetical protein
MGKDPKKKVVLDIFYSKGETYNTISETYNTIEVMVTDEDGCDVSIGNVNIPDDTPSEVFPEHRQEMLYELAYEVAHKLGYILDGECYEENKEE